MINFNKAEFVTSYGVPEQIAVSDRPEVVFCGRSNVGKSSLLNKLCNRKNLARVSSKPGKTTTINLFSIAGEYWLTDLPGYGFARRSDQEKLRWAGLMEGFFRADRNIVLAMVLLDSRHDPTADDEDMIRYLIAAGIPFLCVLTKTDKLNKTEFAQRTAALSEFAASKGAVGALPFSVNGDTFVKNIQNVISGYLELQK